MKLTKVYFLSTCIKCFFIHLYSNSYFDLHVSRSEIQHQLKTTSFIKITIFSACVDIHVLIPNRYIEFFATSEKIAI